MKKNALTLTVVANMTSNYGEGLGNASSVQKIYKNQKEYAMRSRESLKNAICVQAGLYDDLETSLDKVMQKKVTEPYLVDALSFTEAEARIIEEMTPFISGEFTVSDIKRANYSELFPSDEESADRWFKCKLIFITLDEKSGAEKKTSTQVLVQAADLRDAVKKLDEGMKGTMADYQIGMVSETPLMDVYPYSAEPNDKPEFDPAKS